jgi:hypothetical protein
VGTTVGLLKSRLAGGKPVCALLAAALLAGVLGAVEAVHLPKAAASSPITYVSNTISDPTALAFDASGDLFIASLNSASVSALPKASGSLFGVPVTADQLSTVASGPSYPTALAFDASGDLFIANLENDTVSELISPPPTTTPPTTAPPTTTPSTTVPTGGPGPSKPGYIVVTPKGGVSSFGAVPNLGSLVSENITPASPIVGDALTGMCPASPWL